MRGGGRNDRVDSSYQSTARTRIRGLAPSTVARDAANATRIDIANEQIRALHVANTNLTFALGAAHAQLADRDPAPRTLPLDRILAAENAALRAALAAERAKLAALERPHAPGRASRGTGSIPEGSPLISDQDFACVVRQRDAARAELAHVRSRAPAPDDSSAPDELSRAPAPAQSSRAARIPSTGELLARVQAAGAARDAPDPAPVSPLAHRSPSPDPAPAPTLQRPVLAFKISTPPVHHTPGSPPPSAWQSSGDGEASDSGSGARRRRRSPAQRFVSLSPQPPGYTSPRTGTASPPREQSATPPPGRSGHSRRWFPAHSGDPSHSHHALGRDV